MSFQLNRRTRAPTKRAKGELWRDRAFTTRLRFESLEDRIQPSSLLGAMDLLGPLNWLKGAHAADADLSAMTAGTAAPSAHQRQAGTSSSGSSVSGEAFGVSAKLTTALGASVSLGKTPDVTIPSRGGFESAQLVSVNMPGFATSDTLTVIASGAIGSHAASSESIATTEHLNLLNGMITSDLVMAVSSSTSNGDSASSNAMGSTLINLSVNGVFMGDVTPAPNTTIDLPGVGRVILNEQIASGDGVHSSALTVNMIHVVLAGALGSGDIIVSSAHSDVNFTAAAKTGPLFMTGGGRLGDGRDIATFGFNVGKDNGATLGHMEFIDHAQGLNIHATSIDSFSVLDATCVTFSGTARVNGVDGYAFTVVRACDNGEPGVGHDTFEISVTGNGLNYSRGGVLTGGNLQLHEK